MDDEDLMNFAGRNLSGDQFTNSLHVFHHTVEKPKTPAEQLSALSQKASGGAQEKKAPANPFDQNLDEMTGSVREAKYAYAPQYGGG